MKNKVFLAVGLVILLALTSLAGCSAAKVAAADVQPVSVNVNSQQGIWVTGEGKITVNPDTAQLYIGVSVTADKVADAQSQAAASLAKVMSVLTANGIDQKDIQTQYFSIQQISIPVYYPNSAPGVMSPPDALGGIKPVPILPLTPAAQTQYQVSNQVTVTVRAIDKTGSIIDAVAAAGGNDIRINGISFSVDKPAQYNATIRELAMQDALAKAQDLARLSGVSLGKPIYISENSYSPGPYPMGNFKAAMDSVGATPTPISPGQTEITLNVQVAYSIE